MLAALFTFAFQNITQGTPPSFPTSASHIAGVQIVGGRLSDLIARIGPGESVVRDYSPFWNGWTYWKISGRKDVVLTVRWEPAFPKGRRKIDSITIDLFPARGHVNRADASRLGFWGTLHLDETPAELTKKFRSLGEPIRANASHLSWKNKMIEISADFEHGHLRSISAQEPTLGGNS